MSIAVHPVDATMAAARAASFTKRSIKEPAKSRGLRLAISMLDLTTLEGKDSPEKVRALCRKALRPWPAPLPEGVEPVPSVAAVCVYPSLVPVARECLAGTSIKVASVATAFPSGQAPLATRLEEVRRAVADGADEIDMVISRGLLLAGREQAVREEIAETRAACGDAHLKIILETGELETLDLVRRASDLAIEAACTAPGLPTPADGEIFIKTSTGKVSPASTMPVALVMMEAIRDARRCGGPRIGLKPAGGIRTAKQALHYLVMLRETLGMEWFTPTLFRIGASSLLDDLLRQVLKAAHGGRYVAMWDVSTA
ncbi:MAG: deoxyribose-phosphate aldolase [Phycisphaerales bacterium]|jgi:deoxyribose-phosphate aldolase